MKPEERCCIKAVGHSLEKGGEADVEEAVIRSTAVPDLLDLGAVLTYHKSVLTARLGPGRST